MLASKRSLVGAGCRTRPAGRRGSPILSSSSAREGHAIVRATYRDEHGFLLGAWINRQRDARRRGDLDEGRSRRLEAVPGWAGPEDQPGRTALRGSSPTPSGRATAASQGPIKSMGSDLVAGSSNSEPLGNAAICRRTACDVSKACRGGPGTPAGRSGRRAMPICCGFLRMKVTAGCRRATAQPTNRLGAWLGEQRQRRDQLLRNIWSSWKSYLGGPGSQGRADGRVAFLHLESYVLQTLNGRSRVPDAYRDGDGYLLGDWVGRQRASLRGSPLRRAEAKARSPTGLDLGRKAATGLAMEGAGTGRGMPAPAARLLPALTWRYSSTGGGVPFARRIGGSGLVDARHFDFVRGVGYGLAFEGLIDKLVSVSVHLAGTPGKLHALKGFQGYP